jgi:cytidylate kinase
VITLSRQYGSGGDRIALKVAERLGYMCVDKDLISYIALRARIPESEIEKYDERSEKPIVNLLLKLFSSEEYVTYIATGTHFGRGKFVEFITSIMLDLYNHGNVVIIGRGGQAILKDKPKAIHVRIIAPFKFRRQRLAETMRIQLNKADDMLRKTDKQRERFLRQYFNIDPDDPSLYHLIINTAKVTEDIAVEMIAHLACAPLA